MIDIAVGKPLPNTAGLHLTDCPAKQDSRVAAVGGSVVRGKSVENPTCWQRETYSWTRRA